MPKHPAELIIDHVDHLPVSVPTADLSEVVEDEAAELAQLAADIAALKDEATELIVANLDNH